MDNNDINNDVMDDEMEELTKLVKEIKITPSSSGNMINFFEMIPDALKVVPKKNPHKEIHHFDNPLILLITGQSGSGKSIF